VWCGVVWCGVVRGETVGLDEAGRGTQTIVVKRGMPSDVDYTTTIAAHPSKSVSCGAVVDTMAEGVDTGQGRPGQVIW